MLDWLACTLVKAASGLLCRLPPGVAVWLGERLGLLACWLQPKRTTIGLANLRAAFDGHMSPAQARRLIRDCYRQLGAGIIEMLRLPAIDRAYVDRYVTVEGRAHFDEAVASGRPVIFLTGHYGNWELSSITAALHGYPIVALARAQQRLPRLYRLLVSYRESKGCTIVHKGGAMKRLIAALGQGRLIGIVGDQASRQGIFVDFFGRPALFATGPFELAYGKGAVILPAFMHRVRGPFHRLVIEPPISFSGKPPKETAVREGIEYFAGALAAHIRQEPSQWLWMHKRWKHTPARRVLVLSDGKLGHLKQSLAVVDAFRDRHPDLRAEVIDVRYRHPLARMVTLLWAWWLPRGLGGSRCLQWALHPETAAALLARYADLIVSCGASPAPVNLLWAAENRAHAVAVMNPAPLPLGRFALVMVPRHDRLRRRPNVVETVGALVARLPEESLRAAGERLRAHPGFRGGPAGGPTVAVFIGGDSAHYALSAAFAESLIRQVLAACDGADGSCLVTTSRRTSPAVERALAEQLNRSSRCGLLLLASRDQLDGTMEGLMGAADVAVVTGESISMVSEVCASGRRIVVPARASRWCRRSAQAAAGSW
ncbi:MAG: mitochondrial fission ELM1 family protein [Candidatus Omnitrophica bacterium]|nr:mitochondrial fission ELM1 family protein [Candidatus Omnitrophota bacterium]